MITTSRIKTGFKLTRFRSSEVAGISYNDRQCYQLNGIDQYVSGPTSAGNWERTDPFSISAWVRANGWGCIFAKLPWSTPPYDGYFFVVNPPGRLWLILRGGSPLTAFEAISTSGNNLIDGNWHHAVATYDGSSLAQGVRLFVDNQETARAIGLNTLSQSILNTDSSRIGFILWSDYWQCQIRQLSLWNKELAPAEVAQLYFGGSPPDLRKLSFFNQCNAWWSLGRDPHDNLGYPSVSDWSGNNRHATSINSPSIVSIDDPLP